MPARIGDSAWALAIEATDTAMAILMVESRIGLISASRMEVAERTGGKRHVQNKALPKAAIKTSDGVVTK
jgi:hypothetical protein